MDFKGIMRVVSTVCYYLIFFVGVFFIIFGAIVGEISIINTGSIFGIFFILWQNNML